MIELFITVILIAFFGLFVMMALPMKDQTDDLQHTPKTKKNASNKPQVQ